MDSAKAFKLLQKNCQKNLQFLLTPENFYILRGIYWSKLSTFTEKSLLKEYKKLRDSITILNNFIAFIGNHFDFNKGFHEQSKIYVIQMAKTVESSLTWTEMKPRIKKMYPRGSRPVLYSEHTYRIAMLYLTLLWWACCFSTEKEVLTAKEIAKIQSVLTIFKQSNARES